MGTYIDSPDPWQCVMVVQCALSASKIFTNHGNYNVLHMSVKPSMLSHSSVNTQNLVTVRANRPRNGEKHFYANIGKLTEFWGYITHPPELCSRYPNIYPLQLFWIRHYSERFDRLCSVARDQCSIDKNTRQKQ